MLCRFYACNPNLLLFKCILRNVHSFLLQINMKTQHTCRCHPPASKKSSSGWEFTSNPIPQNTGGEWRWGVRKGPEKHASFVCSARLLQAGVCVHSKSVCYYLNACAECEKLDAELYIRLRQMMMKQEKVWGMLSFPPPLFSLSLRVIHHGCRRAFLASKAHSPQHMRS